MKLKIALLSAIAVIGLTGLYAQGNYTGTTSGTFNDSARIKFSALKSSQGEWYSPVKHYDESNSYEINYFHEIISHLHNKLVHFPIALTILAFLFTFLGKKWNELNYSLKFIVTIAALFSFLVMFTGLYQSGDFVGKPKEWIVNLHSILGLMASMALCFWAIVLWKDSYKKYAKLMAYITLILMIITGFYGGVIAH